MRVPLGCSIASINLFARSKHCARCASNQCMIDTPPQLHLRSLPNCHRRCTLASFERNIPLPTPGPAQHGSPARNAHHRAAAHASPAVAAAPHPCMDGATVTRLDHRRSATPPQAPLVLARCGACGHGTAARCMEQCVAPTHRRPSPLAQVAS